MLALRWVFGGCVYATSPSLPVDMATRLTPNP